MEAGQCSRTCGEGQQERIRFCFKGDCAGRHEKDAVACNAGPCPGKYWNISFHQHLSRPLHHAFLFKMSPSWNHFGAPGLKKEAAPRLVEVEHKPKRDSASMSTALPRIKGTQHPASSDCALVTYYIFSDNYLLPRRGVCFFSQSTEAGAPGRTLPHVQHLVEIS